ncbi:androgen-binding protein homolog [Mesocricetus auratus]|uniref:Androgen-binding protein homolog n=1 Tax=Mesocricetus auratus TaxID=10036 RepID=A0ABM2WKN7_MESAU|nr:androgen-binding protein homolog [Mesocricetus auratus]
MKGTLLLLALLVTGELGFQTMEACVTFYEAFSAVVLGNKQALNIILNKFNPTANEWEAFEKIQECYNEGRLKSKLLDMRVMLTSPLTPIPHAHMVPCCVQYEITVNMQGLLS